MSPFSRKLAKNSLAAILGFCLFFGATLSNVWAGSRDVDVYVVFSGKDKQEKKALKNALPANLKVKFYNVDLLALADYSGKQKAVAKLETAKMIVIIKDRPLKLLQGSTFAKDLFIVGGAQNSVKSENWTLYVVDKGTNLSAVGANLKTHNAATVGDLSDLAALRAADAVLIDSGGLDIYSAVAKIVSQALGS